jgi:hypothetical protein
MQTLTIDYLIINLKGSLTEQKQGLNVYKNDILNPFVLTKHEYGNKTFSQVYDLIYQNEKIGVIQSVPRSNIIADDLIQLQFENHLFYTKSLSELSHFIFVLTDFFSVSFEGINRVDIAKDECKPTQYFNDLFTNITNGNFKIKGREKNIQAHYLTHNGITDFNGFSIGKRNSSRFLRVYNKTKALQVPTNPKPYINEYLKLNNLQTSDPVWRFEYQLNSSFFTYLRKLGQNITYQLFDFDTLIQLIQLAEKNHFELVYNTGKKETNKEKTFLLNNWDLLRKSLNSIKKHTISRIKKAFEITINIQKRLVKSLLRQYYLFQETIYLYTLSKIINEYNLKSWFETKKKFYFNEFDTKEKIKNHFDFATFEFNLNTLLY